jgi:hypothetical protein
MADKSTRYDEEFKNLLCPFTTMVKLRRPCARNTVFPNRPWPNGLNNTPRLKLKMAKFSPLRQIKDLQKRNGPA